MSVAVMFKISAQPGKRDELVAAFQDLLAAVEDEPQTQVYVLHTADNAADDLWFYELYPDKEAQETHAGSDALKALFPKVAPLLAGRPEIFVLTPVGGKGVPIS
jgi:quinol monooxygenase YgiN